MSETTNLKLFKHDNPSTNTNQFNVEISLNGNWDKIDEFAGGTDRKIEEAESKTEILEQEYAELKENLDNILPPGQAGPDEDITINDSAKYPCVVEVEGNSWQETREGYNIVKSVRNNTVKAITFNIEKSKITETMYLSLIATENLGTTNRVYFNDTSSNLTAINKGPMDIVANQKAVKQITFTAEELATLKNSENDIIMQLYENDTEKDYTAIDFTEVMLSSSNTTNYEEYGASPSTAYPSNLEAVGDSGSVKISVENQDKTEEQNVTFPFTEGQKLLKNGKLGDTGIIQNRKRFTLDGTESWFLSTLNTYQWFGLNRTGIKAGNEFICSHLKNYERIGNYEGIANHNTANRVYIAIEGITTVEQLKTYLSEQNSAGTPITIEYELAEPETVAYTEAQKTAKEEIDKLKTYKGVTYITTDSKAILDVSYKKDLEILINNLSNAGEG